MKKFVIADTHFGHQNIIKYCNRSCETVEQMDRQMIADWNEVVSPKDEVYHVGDFSFSSEARTNEILSQLNGKIYLTPGNHDGMIVRRGNKFPRLTILPVINELKILNKTVVLCHYPMESWNKKFHGSIHLHGHVHGKENTMNNRFDVGIDMIGKPTNIEEFLK